MSTDINDKNANVEHNEKMLKKCLDIYDRRRSVRFVQNYFDRVEGLGAFELYDQVMSEIKQRYLPDFTIVGFVEECLNRYRERTSSLEGIYELARSETPLTEDDYREWETSFSERVKKEAKPPTNDQWSELSDSLLQ